VNVRSNALLGMWFSLAAIAMLFIGLTSAYAVRRGLDPLWSPVPMPTAALPACACLLASSITLEYGRRSARQSWLLLTGVLAIAFVAGQLAACRELAAAGFYLSTNPHSSFVYVFTALHGVHVVGGVLALASGARTEVVALYWHAMAMLWTYLLVVLFVWK
jgi:cytochrome c oxidase subunit III